MPQQCDATDRRADQQWSEVAQREASEVRSRGRSDDAEQAILTAKRGPSEPLDDGVADHEVPTDQQRDHGRQRNEGAPHAAGGTGQGQQHQHRRGEHSTGVLHRHGAGKQTPNRNG